MKKGSLALPLLSNTITPQIVLQALTSVCKVKNLFSYCTMYLESNIVVTKFDVVLL